MPFAVRLFWKDGEWQMTAVALAASAEAYSVPLFVYAVQRHLIVIH
jgi:hypothetical protein